MVDCEESRSASFSASPNKKRKLQAFDPFATNKKKKKPKGPGSKATLPSLNKLESTQNDAHCKTDSKKLDTNIVTEKAGKKLVQFKQSSSTTKCKVYRPAAVNFKELKQQCTQLPIFSAKHKLLQQIKKLSSAILIGETGSGKTTQIPKYLYEAGLHQKHMIAVTQPRRVAAITVAQRVAAEMGTTVGQLVGYCVRFDDCTSESTKIKYMTDGMLLREAILDPLMKRYSVVMLDEAHERTIHTDVLFGVVKSAQRRRRKRNMLPLKIIVMSATMDVDHFSQYFNKAPVLYVEGRQFPIQLMYSSEEQSDYLFASIVTVFQIQQTAPAHEAILVFLTGQEEIESMVRSIRDIAHDLPSTSVPLLVLPLYAALPPAQQLKVFQPAPKGHRKVIVSTNIAETSVTIHGIKHVIDSGKVKLKWYQPNSGLELLKVCAVSQAQAWQRTGRAGRQSAGFCYRLYTEPHFSQLPTDTTPEIQRCSLSNVVLQLMALGIRDVVHFNFLDKPSNAALEDACQQLLLLEAVTKQDADSLYTLTDAGRQMAAFPLEPRLAKVLLTAHSNDCLEEILTIVSVMSADSVLYTPHSKREEANAVRRKFMSPDGDHLTLLNICRSYRGVNGNKQWCFENFINQKNMKLVLEIRAQLRDICNNLELEIKSCGHDTVQVRKSIVAGFFMNAAELEKHGHYVTVCGRKSVLIHPSSALFMSKPSVVIYNELIETNKCYIRDVCVVDPDWLYDTNPAFFKRKTIAR